MLQVDADTIQSLFKDFDNNYLEIKKLISELGKNKLDSLDIYGSLTAGRWSQWIDTHAFNSADQIKSDITNYLNTFFEVKRSEEECKHLLETICKLTKFNSFMFCFSCEMTSTKQKELRDYIGKRIVI